MGLCKETEGSRVIFQLKHKSHSLEAQDEGLALDPCGSQQIQGELEFPSRTRLGIFPVFPRFFLLFPQSVSSTWNWLWITSRDHFQSKGWDWIIRESSDIPNFVRKLVSESLRDIPKFHDIPGIPWMSHGLFATPPSLWDFLESQSSSDGSQTTKVWELPGAWKTTRGCLQFLLLQRNFQESRNGLGGKGNPIPWDTSHDPCSLQAPGNLAWKTSRDPGAARDSLGILRDLAWGQHIPQGWEFCFRRESGE